MVRRRVLRAKFYSCFCLLLSLAFAFFRATSAYEALSVADKAEAARDAETPRGYDEPVAFFSARRRGAHAGAHAIRRAREVPCGQAAVLPCRCHAAVALRVLLPYCSPARELLFRHIDR